MSFVPYPTARPSAGNAAALEAIFAEMGVKFRDVTPEPECDLGVTLNDGQAIALAEILASYEGYKRRHLLTGYAGTGKTTLMQAVVKALKAKRVKVVVTAPTHKAVQVLAKKLDEAGISSVKAMTIHALLGLKPTAGDSEKSVLKRSGRSQAGEYDAVIIDECSMIGSDLHAFLDNDLHRQWVLFVGDPAQLPPVGEVAAPCFAIENRSNLAQIVRQAEGNPILQAATALRQQQGSAVDWSWCRPAEAPPHGVYLAGDDANEWMRDAFTSDEFRANNDAFRFIAYTNARVHEVNQQVRRWIYGDTQTPFVPGERVICRKPVMLPHANTAAFTTNEEAVVASITRGVVSYRFDQHEAEAGKQAVPAFVFDMPVWKVGLHHGTHSEVVCDLPINPQDAIGLDRRLVSEAKVNRSRWFERFTWLESIADLRSVYAMTCHSSQGSTFDNVFLDVRDCSKIEMFRPMEMQQLLYVAVTRPRFALVLIGGAR